MILFQVFFFRALKQSSQATKPEFFKVILQQSIQDGKLEIPIEFVRKFGRELPGVAILKVPDGKEWLVELKKIDGVVWFHDGWRGFLKYYNISSVHFLVFRYDGNAHFFVLILNERGCGIEYPRNVDIPRESNLLNKDEDTFIVDDHMCTALAERTRRPITTPERMRAKRSAQMLRTERPSFMVDMKPSYLTKGLNVPLKFARKHFTKGAHNVTVQLPNGRTWAVRLCFHNPKQKALLSGGWRRFVQENTLEDGDCCSFELLKADEIELKVSIIRKEVQPCNSV